MCKSKFNYVEKIKFNQEQSFQEEKIIKQTKKYKEIKKQEKMESKPVCIEWVEENFSEGSQETDQDNDSLLIVKDLGEELEVECKFCEKSGSVKQIKKHFKKNHPEEFIKLNPSSEICQICKLVIRKVRILEHVQQCALNKQNEKNEDFFIKCNFCDKKGSKDQIARHIKNKHKDEFLLDKPNSYKCKYCKQVKVMKFILDHSKKCQMKFEKIKNERKIVRIGKRIEKLKQFTK